MYAGHATRFLNLEAHTRDDRRIRPTYRRVTGWVDGGALERVPAVPAALKGRARAALEAAAFATLPRPDVIWSSAREAVAPYLWAQLGGLRRPLVLDFDWTLEQQEALAPIYFGRPSKRGIRLAIARLQERFLWRSVTIFTPWSQWAADSLRRQGVAEDRIRVIPPGVDLEEWQPRREARRKNHERLRLLFVGGDFARKGGDILLDVFRARFADRCELDVVTREALEPPPGVRLHRAEPNSPLLKELYTQADIFVLPTRAECFGIATVEAMASGLPVIAGDVGGAKDIVDDGETGWLIEPTAVGLAGALEDALRRRERLWTMGRRARLVAETRFDGRANDGAVVDAVLEAWDRFSHPSTIRPASGG
jgi:glycosyltransferase involved in cell wall biosynthesis